MTFVFLNTNEKDSGSKISVFKPLDEMNWLAEMQRARLAALCEKEIRRNIYLRALTPMLKRHVKLMVDIHNLRFDLGLDPARKHVNKSREQEEATAREQDLLDRQATNGVEFKALEEMLRLAHMERAGIEALCVKEKRTNVHLRVLDLSITRYRKLLVKIQKIRFELGLDLYKSRKQRLREQEEERQREHELLYRQICAL
ncbi:MAG TPA: hypothetical protein VF133_12030 [Terriglobales bacterium]